MMAVTTKTNFCLLPSVNCFSYYNAELHHDIPWLVDTANGVVSLSGCIFAPFTLFMLLVDLRKFLQQVKTVTVNPSRRPFPTTSHDALATKWTFQST